MASTTFETFLVERNNFRNVHVISNSPQSQPLGPSSIRVQVQVLTLTTNNITYGRFGSVPGFNYFDFHPIPQEIVQTKSLDPSKYACPSAWGIGTVIESSAAFVPVGTQLSGYFPISSLPTVKPVKQSGSKDVIVETSAHRKDLLDFYDRYMVIGSKAHGASQRYQAYSGMIRVLFETAWGLNRLVFSWDHEHQPINPMGPQPPAELDTWSKENADLKGATVFILPGSSKTAFAFAYVLRHARPKHEQPRSVVAISSNNSSAFCKELKLYDHILPYEEAEAEPAALAKKLGLSRTGKTVLVDCGGRGESAREWYSKLAAISPNVLLIRVGGPIPQNPELEAVNGNVLERWMALPPNSYPSNICLQRESGVQLYGEEGYYGDLAKDYDKFAVHECLNALELKWGEGISGENGIEAGWDLILSGNLKASEGLVYSLP